MPTYAHLEQPLPLLADLLEENQFGLRLDFLTFLFVVQGPVPKQSRLIHLKDQVKLKQVDQDLQVDQYFKQQAMGSIRSLDERLLVVLP